LLLIGSLFVPLFGIVLADYFVVRRWGLAEEAGEWRISALVAWLAGILIYQAITQWAPQIGASIPCFLLTFLLYTGLRRLWQQRLVRVSREG